MFGSAILEVAIGMVFLYLLLSLVCSAANELIEGRLKNRAKDLERGLRELLQDSGLVQTIYSHPLISSLFAGKYDPERTGNLPSYIPARSFALALLDVAAADPAASPVPENVAKTARMLVDAVGRDAAKNRENVEAWFNSSMERVAGWYKRRAQTIIFCIGLVVALVMNADSITIANGLANDQALRDSLVAAAQTYSKDNPPAADTVEKRVKENLEKIAGIGLPIGWSGPGRIPANPGLGFWLLKLLGCVLTACATSLGAPFWFDMLNKIITARSTIKPQEKTPAPQPA